MQQTQVFLSSACSKVSVERQFVHIVFDDLGILVNSFPHKNHHNDLAPNDYYEQMRNSNVCVIIFEEIQSEVIRDIKSANMAGVTCILLSKTTKNYIGNEANILLSDGLQFEFFRSFQNLRELKQTLLSSFSQLLGRRLHAYVGLVEGHDAGYKQALDLMQFARSKVILVQETSTLILGPRKASFSEISFYNGLITYCQKCKQDREIEFVHLFALNHTKKELSEESIGKYIDPLRSLAQLRGLLGPNVRVTFTQNQVSSMIVCDDSFGIGMDLGTRAFTFARYQTTTSKQFIDRIEEILKQEGTKSFENIQSALIY